MSAALENYKADNGVYPSDTATEALNARSSGDPTSYQTASLFLYEALSGDSDANRAADQKSYLAFKPNMLLPLGGTGNVTAICDPFGKSYGYSTAYQKDASTGYNPTFDLWSTGGETAQKSGETFQEYQARWIKNW